MKRLSRGIVLVVSLAMLGLIVPSLTVAPARAACGGGDDDFAEFYGPYAATVVLGRYEGLELAPTPAAPFVIEPGEENVAVIRVLRVYRGTADETVRVDPDVLGDCTAPTEEGERIMLAFVEASPDGSFVGSWHEDERGRWWHHFDRYPDLDGLLRALGAMPDTSTQPSAGPGGSGGLDWWLVVWAALTATLLVVRRVIAAPSLATNRERP